MPHWKELATVEKAKDYVTKFGGTITEVEEWGKKKLAYEIQHMKEGYYYFITNANSYLFIVVCTSFWSLALSRLRFCDFRNRCLSKHMPHWKEQHMKEGYYYFIKFDGEATVPGELEQAVRIMDNVHQILMR